MELNDKQKESLLKEAAAYFDGEIPDDLLEYISGGRKPYAEECMSVSEAEMMLRKDFKEGKISSSERFYIYRAVEKYLEYIWFLPNGSEPVLFVYEEWK